MQHLLSQGCLGARIDEGIRHLKKYFPWIFLFNWKYYNTVPYYKKKKKKINSETILFGSLKQKQFLISCAKLPKDQILRKLS